MSDRGKSYDPPSGGPSDRPPTGTGMPLPGGKSFEPPEGGVSDPPPTGTGMPVPGGGSKRDRSVDSGDN